MKSPGGGTRGRQRSQCPSLCPASRSLSHTHTLSRSRSRSLSLSHTHTRPLSHTYTLSLSRALCLSFTHTHSLTRRWDERSAALSISEPLSSILLSLSLPPSLPLPFSPSLIGSQQTSQQHGQRRRGHSPGSNGSNQGQTIYVGITRRWEERSAALSMSEPLSSISLSLYLSLSLSPSLPLSPPLSLN